jgi:hypothetical protein
MSDRDYLSHDGARHLRRPLVRIVAIKGSPGSGRDEFIDEANEFLKRPR